MSATLDHINGLVFVPQLREFEAERYQQCNCCPYGYHIDLDFVRYCEALSHGNEISTSKQKRRERRRQRHSMEVLLGLTSPSLWTIEQQLPEVPLEESPPPEKSKLVQKDIFEDALSKAVEVFEDTLQRTHKSNNAQFNTDYTDGVLDGVFYGHWPGGKREAEELPDSESTTLRTTPVGNSVSGKIRRRPGWNQESQPDQVYSSRENEVNDVTVQHDSDAASVGSATSNVSTLQIHPELQNIREQMAMSLERMRELEEQVKLIPILQIQLAILKEEKRLLTQKLQENGAEDMKTDDKIRNEDMRTSKNCDLSMPQEDITKVEDQKHMDDAHNNSECNDRTFSDDSCFQEANVESKSVKTTFRNRGITCSVVTRDVGVSHLHPKTRNVGTNTYESPKKLSFSGMRRENILPDLTIENMNKAEKLKQLPVSMNISNLNTRKEQDIPLKLSDLQSITVSKKSVSVLTDLQMADIQPFVLKSLNIPQKNSGERVNRTCMATQTLELLKPVLHITEHSDFSVQVSSEDFSAVQNEQLKHRMSAIDVGVQCDYKLTKHAGVQFDHGLWQTTKGIQYEPAAWCKDTSVQVDLLVRNTVDVGVTVKPKSVEFGMEAKVISRDKGTSTASPNVALSDKCTVPKSSVSVARSDKYDEKLPTISLISLNESPDSQNYSMTKDHSKNITSTVACGPDWRFSTSRSTDTYDLVRKKDVSSNTIHKQVRDVGICHTSEKLTNEFNGDANSEASVTRDVSLVETALSLSRIPRLTGPVSPTIVRTPTKHGATILSTADKPQKPVSPTPTENNPKSPSSSVPKLYSRKLSPALYSTSQEKLQEPERNQRHHLQRQSTYTKLPEVTEIYSEHVETRQDNRVEPTKEMKAALKVINDYFKKNPSKKDLPKHLTNASNIVQQEWFKISGGKSVNPLAVEDYLDYIEGCSTELLEYVVNMTDISGNTALHYAVSSGNFDVISILLDSKVCNVNKRNAAGYTCVMLATLVKLRCETHRQIIRRMFHLADVNIKAKPHGQTALMLATSHGSLEMVEMLTEAGADMNIQDADGSTALMCAADHGFIDIVKHIIAQPDCDVTLTDSDGCTALNIAMESGNRHVGFLLYAHEHFSQGNSPHGSLRSKRSRSSTPTSRSNTLSSSRPGGTPAHNEQDKNLP